MTEIFRELCPVYMVYGMTWEQYWYGDPWMVREFRDAYLMKRRIDNENAWINGLYITNAVSVAIENTFGGKHERYIEKPIDLFEKTEAEKAAEVREERRKLIEGLTRLKAMAERRKQEKKKINGGETDGNGQP